MEILSHRYLMEGKNQAVENTLSQLKRATKYFSFFETDIRRLPGGEFYISHNPQSKLTGENNAIGHAQIWRDYPEMKIALNIKELGYEKDLIDFLKFHGVTSQIFLFDMELLGAPPQSYINQIKNFGIEIEIAVRVSDWDEPVSRALAIKNSKIVWLDEFDSFWVTQKDIRVLKAAGKIIYCISPDLHNFSLEQTRARWNDFLSWRVDGICTDYALQLKRYCDKCK